MTNCKINQNKLFQTISFIKGGLCRTTIKLSVYIHIGINLPLTKGVIFHTFYFSHCKFEGAFSVNCSELSFKYFTYKGLINTSLNIFNSILSML